MRGLIHTGLMTVFAVATVLVSALIGTVQAATIVKANNTTSLSVGSSWVGGVVPGILDIAQWSSTVTGSNTTTLGTDCNLSEISILNPGGAVTVNADGNTLGLYGITGIDMSNATQNLTLNCPILLGSTQTWNVASAHALTVGGVVSGSFGLNLVGSGSTVLTGSNTYTGGTTISGGTLQLGIGQSSQDGSITSTSGVTDNGLLVYDLFGNQSPAYVVTGSGRLVNMGSAILTLNNNYTGATTVSAGTLTLTGNPASVGTTIVGNVASTAATLNVQGNLPCGVNGLYVGYGAAGVVNQFAGLVSFTGQNSLLIGNVTGGVSGTYNMSGGTIASFSSMQRGVMLGVNAGSFGNPIYASFNLSGTAYLDIPNSMLAVGRYDAASNYTNDSYTQTAGTAAVGTLAIGGISSNVAATFSVTGGSFSAASFPSLCAGSSSSGTITIGGAAQVTLPAFPTGLGAGSTATLYLNGGTLTPAAGSSNYLGGVTLAYISSGGASLNVLAGKNITISQALMADPNSAGGGLTLSGSGQLTLTGVNSSYAGGTTLRSGTVSTGGTALGTGLLSLATGSTVNVNANSGLTGFYYLNSATIAAGKVSYFFNGLSTLKAHFATLLPSLVAQSNSVAGTVFSMDVNGEGSGFPALVQDNNQDFEAIYSGAINVAASGAYTFGLNSDDGSVIFIDGNAVVSKGGGSESGSPPQQTGTANLSAGYHQIAIGYYQGPGAYGLQAYYDGVDTGGTLKLIPNSVLTPDLAVGSVQGSGKIQLTASLYAGSDNTNQTYSGTISGIGGVTKMGTGTWTIMGSNTYTGPTAVSAGMLQIGNGGSGASIGSTGSVSIGKSATLAFNHADAVTLAAAISGSGNLTQAGTGVLTLLGSNTYSGGTTVSGGTLDLNGAASLLAGSSLTIGSASGSPAVIASPLISPSASPSLAPVPEPGTFVMLAIAALAGIGIWRRRSSNRFTSKIWTSNR